MVWTVAITESLWCWRDRKYRLQKLNQLNVKIDYTPFWYLRIVTASKTHVSNKYKVLSIF